MTFVERIALNRHLKMHTGEKDVVCNKKFTKKIILKDTYRRKEFCVQDVWQEICSKRQLEQKSHTQYIVKKKRRTLCARCDKKFTHRSSLNMHLSIHTGETIFHAMCDKKFVHRKNLNDLHQVHSGEKNFIMQWVFICSVCHIRKARQLKYYQVGRQTIRVRYVLVQFVPQISFLMMKCKLCFSILVKV